MDKAKIERTKNSLEKNGFKAIFFESPQEVNGWLLEKIKKDETVGIGGSKTVRELGIVEELKKRGNTLFDHWEEGLTPEEVLDKRKKQMLADIFLTSANAITEKGEIVNREGVGNRINAMTFGPKRTYIIVGKNKIVPDIESAIERIKKIAAPLRNKSLNTPNPCVKKGECTDCDYPTRICRITHIIHRCPSNSDITVIIVNEEMGF